MRPVSILLVRFMDRIWRSSCGEEEVQVGDWRFSHLLFADDVVLMAPQSSVKQPKWSGAAEPEGKALSLPINLGSHLHAWS